MNILFLARVGITNPPDGTGCWPLAAVFLLPRQESTTAARARISHPL